MLLKLLCEVSFIRALIIFPRSLERQTPKLLIKHVLPKDRRKLANAVLRKKSAAIHNPIDSTPNHLLQGDVLKVLIS